MSKRIPFYFFLVAAVLCLSPAPAVSQDAPVLTLTAENLKTGSFFDASKANWEYRAGDDERWAAADFDDADWRPVGVPTSQLDKLSPPDWRGGPVWFRLRFRTDESLRGKPLTLAVWQQLGASEVYLDGRLVRRFGEIGGGGGAAVPRFVNTYSTPFAVRPADADEHLLAVRYRSAVENPESAFARWTYSGSGGNGFFLAFGNADETIAQREQAQRASLISGVSRAGIFLAVGLVYLLLFWFYTPQRANLYFGLYAFLTAVSNFLSYAQYAAGDIDLVMFTFYRVAGRLLFLSYSLAFLLFLYRAFLPRTPRFFAAGAGLWALGNFTALFFPQAGAATAVFGVLTVGFVAECLRVMWLAVRRRAEGAWIVALGVLTALIGPLRFLYLAVGLTIPREFDFYLGFVSSYGMLAAVSVYLARNFARTNKKLEAQLVKEVEYEKERARLAVIEAENERRAKELEEARQLQLSMLPKKLPQLPNLEIAAYMKPAAEVGGDYYDFHLSSDGTLTVAVGDATGHGLKAGTMVTATKSLFNSLAHEPEIGRIFRQSSAALRRMNLRGMFMAMTMAKIKDHRLTVSCAGMPPVLVYRGGSGRVEEVSVRAMPLGSPLAAPFEQREITLSGGDCILVMSDGFPEMFNEKDEMLGFEKAKRLLEVIAGEPAQGIIARFVQAGEAWAGGRPQGDDVTFVVLKVKGGAPAAAGGDLN